MTVARPKPRLARIRPPKDGLFRLRVGNGEEEGFIRLDIAPPWPIDDGVVDAIYSAFQFHRLGRPDRYRFMNEAYRVLKPGAQLSMVMPHWSSMRAITDPLAEWPPLCESSFMVYSRKWREQEQMADLPLSCDFGDVYGYGHGTHPDLNVRNDEFVAHAKEHEVNWIFDLHVTLTKQ